jgi:hypothetical protein
MEATITILAHSLIAAALVWVGYRALSWGYRLLHDGKGMTKEKSSIELAGFKANVSSIGGLTMVTAFLWGWAAVFALPAYQNDEIEVSSAKELELKINELAQLQSELGQSKVAAVAAVAEMAELEARNAAAMREIAELHTELEGGKVAAIAEIDKLQIEMEESKATAAAANTKIGKLETKLTETVMRLINAESNVRAPVDFINYQNAIFSLKKQNPTLNWPTEPNWENVPGVLWSEDSLQYRK